ncbi:hypothetical protein KNT64_gp103 [Pseudomonas phage PspYZU05]|uniref:Uncharacterized protein n=1 Tax=Pseudomonas phage PspYZU05 TaxID=1983556 RepID=A0A2U7N2K8_9CAUD|nr:hypothetical protein KNT64_gp103 [Pseudomonas phage PspYZU05]ASD52055.1 hypothetical protein PspYZU05_103 [Pseudomonas phage PspYZU05]
MKALTITTGFLCLFALILGVLGKASNVLTTGQSVGMFLFCLMFCIIAILSNDKESK